MSRGGPLVARLSATSRSNDLNVLLRDASAAMTHAAFSRKQGFSQALERGKGMPQARGPTLLVCKLHMELPGDRVHSLPQMRTPVPAYCKRRSLSLRLASAKVVKGCLCTMLSSSVKVCPSGCTCNEQKYSEHAGHGLSLGALFSSSQRK